MPAKKTVKRKGKQTKRKTGKRKATTKAKPKRKTAKRKKTPGRDAPEAPSTRYAVGTAHKGNDGTMWVVGRDKEGHYWMRTMIGAADWKKGMRPGFGPMGFK